MYCGQIFMLILLYNMTRDHKTKITLYDTPTQNKIEIFYKKIHKIIN